MPILKAIGLMCGTSKDGIDAAIIQTNGNNDIQTIAGKSIEYPPIFSTVLRIAAYSLQQTKGDIELAEINFNQYLHEYIDKMPNDNSTEEVINSLRKYLGTYHISVDNITKKYTSLYSNLIKDLLKENVNLKVDVIGDHGITLYHNPKNSNGELIGFDTGPANVFLDLYIRTSTEGKLHMDQDGQSSLSGEIIDDLIQNLKDNAIIYSGENYLEKLPPKSLCISNYNDINNLVKKEYAFNDVCATLSAFTAYCITEGIKLVKTPVQTIITCGGGSKNLAITYYLKFFALDLLEATINVISADEARLSSQYMEAELFGYLAVKSLHGDPITFPGTTGCKEPLKGGHCYLPKMGSISDYTAELLNTNPSILNGYTEKVEVLGDI